MRWQHWAPVLPGLGIALGCGMVASALPLTMGGSAALFATTIGIALNPIARRPVFTAGLDFASGPLLRLAIALLGFRISLSQVIGLGVEPLAIIVISIGLGVVFAVSTARWLGIGQGFGLISGMAVSICGVSAALAAAATLPRSPQVERDVAYVALAVTLLSTVAMVIYPLAAELIGWSPAVTGIFLGATIHDLAQVIGAAYGLSSAAGDAAVVTKLTRVAMLVPCVVVLAIVVRRSDTQSRRPSVPWFIVAFAVIVAANSLGLVPGIVGHQLALISNVAFAMAIAAIIMKLTRLGAVWSDWRRALLVIAHTGLLAIFVAAVLTVWRGIGG